MHASTHDPGHDSSREFLTLLLLHAVRKILGSARGQAGVTASTQQAAGPPDGESELVNFGTCAHARVTVRVRSAGRPR